MKQVKKINRGVNNGKIGRPARPPLERFLDHVSPEPNSGCWIWTSSASGSNGSIYGKFTMKWMGEKKNVSAHRASWRLFHKRYPGKKIVRHKCDNSLCVNPDHLELGTLKDNSQDCLKRGRNFWANKTHCKNGHPLAAIPRENKARQTRGCRICMNKSTAKWNERDSARRLKARKIREAYRLKIINQAKILSEKGWHRDKIASALSVNRVTVWRWMKTI